MATPLVRCCMALLKRSAGFIASVALICSLTIVAVVSFKTGTPKIEPYVPPVNLRNLVAVQPGQSFSENVFPTAELPAAQQDGPRQQQTRRFVVNRAVSLDDERAYMEQRADRVAWNTFGRQETLATPKVVQRVTDGSSVATAEPYRGHEVHLTASDALPQPTAATQQLDGGLSAGAALDILNTLVLDVEAPSDDQAPTAVSNLLSDVESAFSTVTEDRLSEPRQPTPRTAKKDWETGRY